MDAAPFGNGQYTLADLGAGRLRAAVEVTLGCVHMYRMVDLVSLGIKPYKESL